MLFRTFVSLTFVLPTLPGIAWAGEKDALTEELVKSVDSRPLVEIKLKDRRSCVRQLNEVRQMKLKALGGISLGAITTYFGTRKALENTLRTLASEQELLQAELEAAKRAVAEDARNGAEVAKVIRENIKSFIQPEELDRAAESFARAAKEAGVSPEYQEGLLRLSKTMKELRPKMQELIMRPILPGNQGSWRKVDLKTLEREILETNQLSTKIAESVAEVLKPLDAETKRLASTVAAASMRRSKNLSRQMLVKAVPGVVTAAGASVAVIYGVLTHSLNREKLEDLFSFATGSDDLEDGTMSTYLLEDRSLYDQRISADVVCDSIFSLGPGLVEKLRRKLSLAYTSKREEALQASNPSGSAGSAVSDRSAKALPIEPGSGRGESPNGLARPAR